jgi:hypothetical protein
MHPWRKTYARRGSGASKSPLTRRCKFSSNRRVIGLVAPQHVRDVVEDAGQGKGGGGRLEGMCVCIAGNQRPEELVEQIVEEVEAEATESVHASGQLTDGMTKVL